MKDNMDSEIKNTHECLIRTYLKSPARAKALIADMVGMERTESRINGSPAIRYIFKSREMPIVDVFEKEGDRDRWFICVAEQFFQFQMEAFKRPNQHLY